VDPAHLDRFLATLVPEAVALVGLVLVGVGLFGLLRQH
jgi:hypothetical protein